GLGRDRRLKPVRVALALLWVACLATFAGELRSLARRPRWPTPEWTVARSHGRALRVVSLNCFVGNPEAAAEGGALEPDVVLLQETPNERAVRDLARRWCGADAVVVYPPPPQFADSCLVARGHVLPSRSATVAGFA